MCFNTHTKKGEIKTFLDVQKQKVFITRRPALQDVLTEVLREEEK